MPLRLGSLFAGRYAIEALLGQGGMGSVYSAYDRTLDRPVALKVLRGEDGAPLEYASPGRGRLVREARLAAALTHPNAVAIYDVIDSEDVTCIAMELVEGRDLRAYIGDASVPLDRRVAWLRDVASALSAAHKRGIIHRDVKPENVKIAEDGVVKVLDFGIARREPAVARVDLTPLAGAESLTGDSFAGTPLYMAPEQIRGEAIDARVDQFAWGVLACEVLTGRRPWGGRDNALGAIADMFTLPPLRARSLIPEVPQELDDAIARALSRSPDARFETMDALIRSMAPGVETGDARQPAPSRRGRRLSLRVVLSSTAVLLAAASFALHSARRAHVTAPQPTADPRALQAYDRGLRDFRAGSLDSARDALLEALRLDPDLAPAQLRLIPVEIESDIDPAPEYRHATSLHDRLDAHDREILEAYAPYFESDPSDLVETEHRLARLAAASPDDADLAVYLSQMERVRLDCSAARAAADRAIALDPDYGFAWMVRVETERVLGQFDAARDDAASCYERFHATDCLIEATWVAEHVGAPDALATARRLQALVPDSWDAAASAAGALFTGGASLPAVRVTLEAARPIMFDGASPATTRAYVDLLLAMASGELGQARALIRRLQSEGPKTFALQVRLAERLIEVDEELGDASAALEDAVSFLGTVPAYSARAARRIQPILLFFRIELEQGKISKGDYERERASQIRTWGQQLGPEGQSQVWLAAYAKPARTADDAREALSVAPAFGEPKFYRGEGLGHVHLLAGDVKGALPELERACRATDVFIDPAAHVHACLDLGESREASGDTVAACEAYGLVVSAWGAASSPSVSLAEATKRRAALACTNGPRGR